MSLPLRALLLSAGFGTRLRPITSSIPKCLVQVGGQPILGIWINKLEELGCEKILINTHYLNKVVEQYVHNYPRKNTDILTVYEEKLLGTAGTLLFNKNFFKNSRILMIHADNVTDADLSLILAAHKKRPKECLITMLTFNTMDPQSCGIVHTDKNGVVKNFYEKKQGNYGFKANGALYIFDYELIDYLEEKNMEFYDFSKDVIPTILGKIYTWHTDANYFDIGTQKSLEKANKIWKVKL